ncbi:hypothetical protein [Salipaludibacillus aurantiacus]|uniref:Fur-regulated basic protein A n=1 Tax=Salipaludibacillus aurantiacus TaxID=1601833 RepID=A0A1H9U157_9BACI|nr:hypothetical protein [Salipaludibacillus aurantiacus]SES02884.1 hypothetical protein SAMN05518684_106212 [Salipaludibacillus aurantiacus]
MPESERERLIRKNENFVQLPPPDFSKMSNEQLENRLKMMETMFDRAFEDKE